MNMLSTVNSPSVEQEAFTVAEIAQLAFTVPETAQFFGRHAAWVYRRVYSGELKVLRDSGRILITRAEIERMLGRQIIHRPKARRKTRSNSGPGQNEHGLAARAL